MSIFFLVEFESSLIWGSMVTSYIQVILWLWPSESNPRMSSKAGSLINNVLSCSSEEWDMGCMLSMKSSDCIGWSVFVGRSLVGIQYVARNICKNNSFISCQSIAMICWIQKACDLLAADIRSRVIVGVWAPTISPLIRGGSPFFPGPMWSYDLPCDFQKLETAVHGWHGFWLIDLIDRLIHLPPLQV